VSNVGFIVHREFESKREKRVIWLRNWQKCAFQFIIYHHTFLPTQSMQFTCCTQITPRPGPTTNTARLSPRYEGKTRDCHCSHWAPDDGRENARNML